MKNDTQIVYFSANLDTEEQRFKNAKIRDTLEENGYLVELPQEYGVCGQDNVNDPELFDKDVDGIKKCDILILNMDAIDDGCLIELGIAYALGKLCMALWPTELRPMPPNNMFRCITASIIWGVQYDA